MANKFSFKEEEQNKIISIYQNSMEEIAIQTNTFIEKVTEVAERTKYLPIVKLGKRCILFYNEDVKSSVENLFEDWIEGEASLVSFIEKMEGGEGASETAVRLQSGLEDAIPDMFNIKDESEFDSIDTSEPNTDEKDFDELKDATIQYKDFIESAKDTAISKIESEKEDNSAYACILAPVSATFTVVISTFEGISSQFDLVKDEFNQKQGELDSTADDVKESTTTQAQTAAEDALESIIVDFHL